MVHPRTPPRTVAATLTQRPCATVAELHDPVADAARRPCMIAAPGRPVQFTCTRSASTDLRIYGLAKAGGSRRGQCGLMRRPRPWQCDIRPTDSRGYRFADLRTCGSTDLRIYGQRLQEYSPAGWPWQCSLPVVGGRGSVPTYGNTDLLTYVVAAGGGYPRAVRLHDYGRGSARRSGRSANTDLRIYGLAVWVQSRPQGLRRISVELPAGEWCCNPTELACTTVAVRNARLVARALLPHRPRLMIHGSTDLRSYVNHRARHAFTVHARLGSECGRAQTVRLRIY
ncbi:hypothetical protein MLGJGCBP_04858 [Rhodococcus sp. T7]|nr:hypothetical protein MLGJGCBP_09892 [Rhodococcus sp. T7]KAF0962076.1 hypothetical protein MLGJGCBP_04858 [Rhodococcus sp. T7]